MTNAFLFIIFLFLLKFYEGKLLSAFGLISHGVSTPDKNIEDIREELQPFIEDNLLPNGLSMHIELGSILKKKYFENNRTEYVDFIKKEEYFTKVKLYSANSPIDIEGTIGEALGMFPNTTPKVKILDSDGKLSDYLGSVSFEKGKHYLKRNKTNKTNNTIIELFSKNLDVVLNSDNCVQINENEKFFNNTVNITNEELNKIFTLNKVVPKIFDIFCKKLNCTDNKSFQNSEFFEHLYTLISFMKEFKIKSKQIPDDVHKMLEKHYLMRHYFYQDHIFKKVSHPILRFVSGYLENTKSQQCKNSTQVKIGKSFIQLRKIKPIDILRQIINDSKCQKIVLMNSSVKNLVTFVKTLFNYEELLNITNIDNVIHDDALLSVFNPPPASSFIFQVHEYEDNKIYIRIFYNLEEISNIKNLKLKIPYIKGRGIYVDQLVSHFNGYCDEKVKYKDICNS